MGKYAATRGFQRDKKSSNGFHSVGNFLFDSPTSKGQFQFQAFMYGFDPTGIYRGYVSSRDYTNYWNDYLKNTGQSWSDVKYPSMMMGFGSVGSTAKSSYLYLSDNLKLLYK